MTEPTPELADSLTIDDAGRLLEAEATVRSRCGWHIAPNRTEEITVDGSGTTVLLLPTLHLLDVVTITENGSVVDLDDVDWSKAGVLTRRHRCWTDRSGAIVVEIEHGHPAAPADISGVVRAIAARISTDGQTLKARTTGPFSETYDGVDDDEQKVIDRYRIPNV